jgi:hypothetical protein
MLEKELEFELEEHAVYTEDQDPEPDGDSISTERLPTFEP